LQLVLCARSSASGFFEVECQLAREVSLPSELHAEDARLAAAGPRDVTLYTRPGCHLCEEAKAAIAPLLREFGAALREVNIDDDAVLRERYGWDVPVIFLGAHKVAKHRVKVERFRRQLRDAR
jgi:glutaredoxin